MNNTILYKGIHISKNTDAYLLYEKKDLQALDKHIKALDNKEKELINRYSNSKPQQL